MSTKPAPKKKAVPTPAGATRISLTLHGTDLERLDELEDYLRGLGHRERNRSLLVKVAVRGLKFSPELVGVLKSAQAEDGRRKRAAN